MSSRKKAQDALLRSLHDPALSLEHPGAARIFWVSVLVVVAFIAWAAWAELDEVTRGDGRVIPFSRVQKIQSLEGGILKQLHVKEGEEVEAGQMLAEIDNTRFRSAYLEGQSHIEALGATVARLEAETLNKDRISVPEGLAPGSLAMASEQALFKAKREKYKASLAALQNELRLARQQLAVIEPLVATRSVGEMEALRLRREAAALEGRLLELGNEYFQQAYSELSAKKAELSALQQTSLQKADQLRRTDLISPVKGSVNAILITTRGGVIQPGEAIMEVIPLDEQLLVEAKVKPKDVAFLVPGMPARVKITAYDYTVFGDLSGRLEQISPDTIQEETPRGKEAFYKILVRTDASHLQKGDEKLPIKPGMVAEVDVLSGKRSVLNYLLRPLIKARLN
jgi:adhesin transport system membrane fusion protein